jgi:hypothetical protein
MPVARSGPLWRLIFVILLIATTASYIVYSRREFPHGGSAWGIGYGVAGTLLILLLAFFGIRKRWYRSRFGTLEQWLQSHIYLGILVFVVLLFHSGGRFNDRIAVLTLILVAIVVASGIAGAVLYVTVPRLLTEVQTELTVDEISEQANQLGKQMARLASGRSQAFQRVYDVMLRDTTPAPFAGWKLLLSRAIQRTNVAGTDWTPLIALVPRQEQKELRQMLVVARQRKELLQRLVAQQRYKNVLEFWLFLHVPFTLALLVFATVHIVAVFYYGNVLR